MRRERAKIVNLQKKLYVRNFPPSILGPEMAAPILWAPGIFGLFLLENHAHKIPRFRRCFFLEGGAEVPILFLCRKAFQSDFGAYQALARVLKSPSNPQNCRKNAKTLKKATFIFFSKPWYAPDPGSKRSDLWAGGFF